jgi:hypothetical protein
MEIMLKAAGLAREAATLLGVGSVGVCLGRNQARLLVVAQASEVGVQERLSGCGAQRRVRAQQRGAKI